MQTKPKQKLTAILIAFTMILTTILQLCIPITVHAEESRNISFSGSYQWGYVDKNEFVLLDTETYEYNVCGNGLFYMRYFYQPLEQDNTMIQRYTILIVSDKPFTINNDNTYVKQYDNKYYWITSTSGGVRILSGSTPVKEESDKAWSTTEAQEYIDSIDLSKDDYEEKTFDEIATYDENIPTPKFKVEKNLRFEFLNNESDYYYEIKGRWYTTDDFYLHLGGFMNAIWLYDYDTIYKNDLTDWITYKDKRNTAITGYLKDIGEKSFNDLITKYPIGTRQITGEKNKDGSYKAGFDHASSNLVMWLKDATSIYNGIEVYIRYYKVDESGNYTYGKWAHYYNGLAKQSGAEVNDNVLNDVEHNYSDKGLTNDELKDLENSGQSKGDTDIITDYGDNGGGILTEIDKLDEIDFSNVVKVILSLFQQTKSIFNMFTTVISFMPNWVTELIGVSVVIICLIGIWKALR